MSYQRAKAAILAIALRSLEMSEATVARIEQKRRGVLEDYYNRRMAGARARGRRLKRGEAPPDEWTAAKRRDANLEAMRALADVDWAKGPTRRQQQAIARYSGWGGLSLEEVTRKGAWPAGVPRPERRGLIHEYYTPTRVSNAIAKALMPYLGTLPTHGEGDTVLALEPSAGIGRLILPMTGPGFSALRWYAAEWSKLSAALLAALRPDVNLTQGPFERWVVEHKARLGGKIGLVVANPPYGVRGSARSIDQDRRYYKKLGDKNNAGWYFVHRGLDLLAGGGIGVFILPSGFMTGSGKRNRRRRALLLRKHHLMASFRLPSGLFPGTQVVVDLMFWRSRGGKMSSVISADQFIVDGDYYDRFPEHILGEERYKGGKKGARGQSTEQASKGYRRFYEVVGDFTGLPPWEPRPICADCPVKPLKRAKYKPERASLDAVEVTSAVENGAALGKRVDAYATIVAGRTINPLPTWRELRGDLEGYVNAFGNPHRNKAVAKAAKNVGDDQGRYLNALLSAYTTTGTLSRVMDRPRWEERIKGSPDRIDRLARILYTDHNVLSFEQLVVAHKKVGGRWNPTKIFVEITSHGWALDAKGSQLEPDEIRFAGRLWPKLKSAQRAASAPPDVKGVDKAVIKAHFEAQVTRFEGLTDVRDFDDIDLDMRETWVPIDIIEKWINAPDRIPLINLERIGHGAGPIKLHREDGLVQIKGVPYEDLSKLSTGSKLSVVIGYLNHDDSLFTFSVPRHVDLGEKKAKEGRRLQESFREFVELKPELVRRVEKIYSRNFLGWREPIFSDAPVEIARWDKDGPTLYPYQARVVRRVLKTGGGLIAFDVGLGKTFTALAIVAKFREEGRAQRPVIVVPNSLAWNWYDEAARVLPDYRIGVIGQKLHTVSRGKNKGEVRSKPDTRKERVKKWRIFQAGGYDLVIVTEPRFDKNELDPAFLDRFVADNLALKREARLKQRNYNTTRRKLSERARAIKEEGVKAMVAEIATVRRPDPIVWNDLGIDLLIVDEAQDYKNLYMPEAREGSVPRYLGNPGAGSQRAWSMDLRAAAVRERANGAGVILLSATPAKNSPLEFYNLLQMVDQDVWTSIGIDDPEQFIDRYMRIERCAGYNLQFEVEIKPSVTGFKNLDDLRLILARYATFMTVEDVNEEGRAKVIDVPEAKVEQIFLDLDARQSLLYAEYEQDLAEVTGGGEDSHTFLGLISRMSMAAVHPGLQMKKYMSEERYETESGRILETLKAPTWDEAQAAIDKGLDYRAPKLTEVSKRINRRRDCGHIVFVESTAVHYWLKKVLIDDGMPPEKIAVVSGVTTNTSERIEIANGFNRGEYDVVIGNRVMETGMNLQKRTCAIHHLDLPWEPATLQQRNGRGVRQGNTTDVVEINYYLADKSIDAYRLQIIQGKHSWLVDLLEGQDRSTNNPAAQAALSPEALLIAISRNPEAMQSVVDKRKATQAFKQLWRKQLSVGQLFRKANNSFRRAERTTDADAATARRRRGENLLRELADKDDSLWPYKPIQGVVRQKPVMIYKRESPPELTFETMEEFEATRDAGALPYPLLWVYEGQVLPVRGLTRRDQAEYREIGRVGFVDPKSGQTSFAWRRLGTHPHWRVEGISALSRLEWQVFWGLLEESTAELVKKAGWSASKEARTALEKVQSRREKAYRHTNFVMGSSNGWRFASDRFLENVWPVAGEDVVAMVLISKSIRRPLALPTIVDGELRIIVSRVARRFKELKAAVGGAVYPFGSEEPLRQWMDRDPLHREAVHNVLPPTANAHQQYMALAPATDIPWGLLSDISQEWWGRPIPRDLLSQARGS